MPNMHKFFDPCVDEIFKKAGIEKAEAPEMYGEAVSIMSEKMATLSVTMGLSKARIDAYEEQKQALVDDLIKLKADSHLR